MKRCVIGLLIAVALVACTASAGARTTPRETEPALGQLPGQAKIAEAARTVEQATLQWDFASNADVLALLHKAQDDLVAAAKQLNGARRSQTDDLLADLNEAIERASTQLGTLVAPGAETYMPRAPDRNDLAQLASEAQELERGVPFAHRLLLTIDVGSIGRGDDLPAHSEIQQTDFALANSDLQLWPPDMQVRWPQVHFRF